MSKTTGYSFGFLDEYAKKEVRRSVLKAIALPGYQVPYSSREMPMGRGFGTGGLQLTLSLIGCGETLKVIDQGSDDSVNAVNLRAFVEMTCPGISTTTRTKEATLIQSRHRIPEKELIEKQVLVLQVPYPDPLTVVEPSEDKRKTMHGEADYSRLLVKLYEDIVKFDEITISHRYPTRINGYYILDPSPIPRFDVPKMHRSRALILFGVGREKKIYAVPPYTEAEPIAFEDVQFRVEDFTDEQGNRLHCARCGCRESFLDEFIDSRSGKKVYQCSDIDWCNEQLRIGKEQHVKEQAGEKNFEVESFSKVYGRGCPYCFEQTGPEQTNIYTSCGSVVAAHDVSFSLYRGEILGIMGESGSGKSTVVKCLYFDEEPTAGRVVFLDNGHQHSLFDLNNAQQRHLKNHSFGMVYQNPNLGLNFDISAGGNIAERLLMSGDNHYERIRGKARGLLSRTEVLPERMDEIPKTFSGGMQQRVQIAKALATDPPLLFLDEVTTGLDLSVQAAILDLILEIQRELDTAMIVVTHDLGVIRLLAGRTLVMKYSRVIESGLTDQILEDPQHAYTQRLVASAL